MKKYLLASVMYVFLLSACSAQKGSSNNLTAEIKPVAFPGAEGFGKYTTGGRGGKVIIVSNLEDKGPGSFREAAEAKDKRIIVFAVSGTIHLETKLNIKGDVTIAGQTAPGDGICLADQSVGLGGDNIIVRYLRFRMGDKYQKGGMVDGNGGDDAFGGTRRRNIIIDHCSMSWSTDEVFSVYGGDSTTLQWNLIAEPLNYSYHFETGDKDYEHHGYGAIWGGRHSSFHHNLFADCNSRTPRFDGIRNIPEENCDFRNNVIYNWGHNNVYAGEGGTYNIVSNYYKWGPDTKNEVKARIANPWNKPPSISFGKYYIDGNDVEDAHEITTNNWQGVTLEKGTAADMAVVKLDKPMAIVEVTTQPAKEAYELVLKNVGATLPKRDTLDERIITNVKNRTGRMIDVQGGFPHGTDYAITINAWPALKSLPAAADTDKDGMPDAWEKKNGLNPNDAADAPGYKLNKNYTNIEVFINSLIASTSK
jgi:pectate lyase